MLRNLAERFKPRLNDVVGLDIAATATKAVRVKRSNNDVSVVAIAALPGIPLAASPAAEVGVPPLELPKRLRGRYASLAVSGKQAVVKLLTFPGHFDTGAESQISQYMGIENVADYRLAYKVIADTRAESKVLAVALPEAEARAACMLLPAGLPVPWSLEVSGLATLSAFLHRTALDHADGAVGVIDFGASTSTVAFVYKGVLSLVRKLDTGTDKLLARVSETLSVDLPTAEQILFGGSVDVSQSITEVMDPFLKQMMISRDFVERREDCHVGRVYVCGGAVSSENWMRQIHSTMGVEVVQWNPFDGLNVLQGAIPAELAGQEPRFAAALGAALATFEEE